MIDVTYEIERLLKFAIRKNLIAKWDIIPARNQLLDILKIDAPYFGEVEEDKEDTPIFILKNILDYAYEKRLIEENTITERDLLDAKIMGTLIPRQSEIIRCFFEKVSNGSVEEATTWFYELCKASNYIRTDRVEKNHKWYTETHYGTLEITINLSKPEKDPKEIAKAKLIKEVSYPKCFLCVDSIGYTGRLDHPARQNLRAIPISLSKEQWFFQYSPYVYYNEHCIVFSGEHSPMKLTNKTIERLIEFVDQFPHYFIGSNADLPIVGGSILTHDHYQGGRHKFPIEAAIIEKEFKVHPFKEVHIGIINWPMSVIRINSCNREKIHETITDVRAAFSDLKENSNKILSFINKDITNQFEKFLEVSNDYYENAEYYAKISENIASMSEEITATVDQVNSAVQDMAMQAQKSSENSESIKGGVNEASMGMNQISVAAQTQAEMAEKLSELVAGFKI